MYRELIINTDGFQQVFRPIKKIILQLKKSRSFVPPLFIILL